jgi:hypothetical protein
MECGGLTPLWILQDDSNKKCCQATSFGFYKSFKMKVLSSRLFKFYKTIQNESGVKPPPWDSTSLSK